MLESERRFDGSDALPLDALHGEAIERNAELGTEVPHRLEKTQPALLQEVFLPSVDEEIRLARNKDQRFKLANEIGTELVISCFLVFKDTGNIRIIILEIRRQYASPFLTCNFLEPMLLCICRKRSKCLVCIILPRNGQEIAPLAEAVFAIADAVGLVAASVQDGVFSSLFVFIHDDSLQVFSEPPARRKLAQ